MLLDKTTGQSKYKALGKGYILSQDGNITKELNFIKWDDNKPVFDLRVWKRENGKEQLQKGIVLNEQEIETLRDILNEHQDIKQIFTDKANQI